MMKFLKSLLAVTTLGCVTWIGLFMMSPSASIIVIIIAALLILMLCATLYSRARTRRDLDAYQIDMPIELSVKPYSPPIMLKTNTTSSGGSGSSVSPMNRVNTTPQNAPKSAMKSSMM